MNFREDAGIERESIQAPSYYHSTVSQIQDKQISNRKKICDAHNAQPM